MKLSIHGKNLDVSIEEDTSSDIESKFVPPLKIQESLQPYDEVHVQNLSDGVKTLSFFRAGKRLFLYNDMDTITTGWLRYEVMPEPINNVNYSVFKNVMVKFEPKPFLADGALQAERIYITAGNNAA